MSDYDIHMQNLYDVLERIAVAVEAPAKEAARGAEQARADVAAELHAARMAYRDIYFANVQRFDALYFAAVNVCIEHQRGTYADDKDVDLLCKALDAWQDADDDEEVARVRAERKAHEEVRALLAAIVNDARIDGAYDVISRAKHWLDKNGPQEAA